MSTQVKDLTRQAAQFILHGPKSHFIAGKWADACADKMHEVMDPCTGEVLATIPLARPAEVDSAVKAAQEAFPAWSSALAADRAVLLHRLADAIERDINVLAQIEALDVGKSIAGAESFDIPFGGAALRYFADLSVHVNYDTPLAIRNIEARVHRNARGPCGFIFPWNFPFTLLLWGIAPALAAGNTVVVKPAETTPLSTLYFCKLAAEIGIPPGVINVCSRRRPRSRCRIGCARENPPNVLHRFYRGRQANWRSLRPKSYSLQT